MAEFMEMSAIISTSTALRATARAFDVLLKSGIEAVQCSIFSDDHQRR
jgi:hypothetical protein